MKKSSKKIEEKNFRRLILLVLYAAGAEFLPIKMKFLSSYLWLLKNDSGLLDFDDSSFGVIELPYSRIFRDDLEELIGQNLVQVTVKMQLEEGFLEWAGLQLDKPTEPGEILDRLLIKFVSITDAGKAWIDKNMGKEEDFALLVDEIASSLESNVILRDSLLFRRVHRIAHAK